MATSTITLKTDTTANWEASNRVLVANEPAIERTTDGYLNMKIGDGTTPWNDLGYIFQFKTLEEIKTYVEQKYNSIVEIKDNVEQKYNSITETGNNVEQKYNSIVTMSDDITEKYNSIVTESDDIETKYNSIVTMDDNITQKHDSIVATSNNIEEKYTAVVNMSNTVKQEYDTVVTTGSDVTQKYNSIVDVGDNVDQKYDTIVSTGNEVEQKYSSITTIEGNVEEKYNSVVTKSDNVDEKYTSIVTKSDNVDQKYDAIVEKSNNFDNKISVLTASAESAITRANNAASAAEGIVTEKVGINDTESGTSTTYSSSKIDTMITTLQSTIGALHTSSWQEVQKIIAAGFGKIAYPVGTQFTTKHADSAFKDSATGLMYWDVVSHQPVLTPSGETKPAMILMAHYASSDAINFDASEDLYHTPEGLAAGTYWFGISTNYDTTYNDLLTGHEDDYQTLTLTKANGTEVTETVIPVQFTTTKDIPTGGTFRLAWSYNTKLSAAKITTYNADKTSLESNITIAEGATGTYLGASAGNVGYGNFNAMSRNRYGSNNWKESNVRQYLNATQATAAEWYSVSTRFDRNGISRTGFIYGLSSSGETDFLSVVKPVRHYTVTNNLYEESGNTGAYDTTDDTFWLASRSEIDNAKEGTIKDGTQFEYFSENTNACRIKYNNSGSNTVGTAQRWWLRSPGVGNAYGARVVYSSGTVNGNGAYNGYRLAPACAIY